MAARQPISKRLRFEVFKRDGFVCQYCGAHPPEVVLEIDHIVAVAVGGTNDQDNLITSCEPCNRGKAARDLAVAPVPLDEKAALIAEREDQLRHYNEIIKAQHDRIENEVWLIVDELGIRNADNTVYSQYYRSIKTFINRLGYYAVLEAVEIAKSKKNRHDPKYFNYFCGICWHQIRDHDGG